MNQNVKIHDTGLSVIRTINDRMMSYNVEMTEVTGGSFWKEYTPEQVAGTEVFKLEGDDFVAASLSMMQIYPPINLYDEKLRKLAKDLGPAWVRISGSWATQTYYDFDGSTNGEIPEGYRAILTKEQWLGVLDFVKEIDAKLLISVANCQGLHNADESWNPSQAEIIFKFSKEYGVPISAAEFVNEPNMLEMCGCPKGYTPENYKRDQDLFFAWVRENYPECICVGPCSTEAAMDNEAEGKEKKPGTGGIAEIIPSVPTSMLLDGTTQPLDVYSYHYYNGLSDRLATMLPHMHWDPNQTLSESFLSVAGECAASNALARDKYCPGGELWVTESGDAGGGGDTWASTYMDVFRTLNELGEFSTISNGVIFHNTLASSDYGFLRHGSFDPRPNYFAVLLWNKIMGTTVYDSKEKIREGAHVYAHSRCDGKEGMAYLVINNSKTDKTIISLPKAVDVYVLSADTLRSTTMKLNGRELVLGEKNELPDLSPIVVEDELILEPATIAFIVV